LILARETDEQSLQKALSLQQARIQSEGKHPLVGEILMAEFGCTEEAVFRALAQQASMPFVPIINERINSGVLGGNSHGVFAGKGRFFRWTKDNGALTIICADPFDLDTVLSIQAFTGSVIQTQLTTPSELKRALALFLRAIPCSSSRWGRSPGNMRKMRRRTRPRFPWKR